MDVVILAGGKGTRLSSISKGMPKPMMEVCGFPFLHYLFVWLVQYKINRVILSVGYKSEVIKDFFKSSYLGIEIEYITEDEPLGTGGAILACLSKIRTDHFFVLNGDTYFPIPLMDMLANHLNNKNKATIAIKELHDFDRYGTIEIDRSQRILKFKEKQKVSQGLINGGIYLFQKQALELISFPKQFSMEKDFFESRKEGFDIYGYIADQYFKDIGIPEDYYTFKKDILNHSYEDT